MYKIYNEDGTVETLIEKEKLDNALSKYMNTNIDKDKLKDDEIFLTSNENLFIKNMILMNYYIYGIQLKQNYMIESYQQKKINMI